MTDKSASRNTPQKKKNIGLVLACFRNKMKRRWPSVFFVFLDIPERNESQFVLEFSIKIRHSSAAYNVMKTKLNSGERMLPRSVEKVIFKHQSPMINFPPNFTNSVEMAENAICRHMERQWQKVCGGAPTRRCKKVEMLRTLGCCCKSGLYSRKPENVPCRSVILPSLVPLISEPLTTESGGCN